MAIHVGEYTLTCALGAGLDALRKSLRANQGGLSDAPWPHCDVPCYLGRVDIPDSVVVAAPWISRNNRLIEWALHQDTFLQAVEGYNNQFGPERVGLVMGTSTSSIDRTEAAYATLDASDRFAEGFRQPFTNNPHAPGAYVAERLGLRGPRITVSAACASSAKVFATAKRWLEQDLVDMVVVGGADTLCLSVVYGFHSLQLVSPDPCRPFAVDRQGISLGEAAGFAVLTRQPGDCGVELRGVGESCDAFHMSSAHPEGLGARLSMERALVDAGLAMKDIDYINLHGTGTRANDATEGAVCEQMMAQNTVASATKGWTGHTLGAAGIVESVLCLDAITTGLVPGTRNTTRPEVGFNLLLGNETLKPSVALTNSFGFGGNNCSVVFAQA